MLAVLALVGSLLAVSAVPAVAAADTADHKATYSACVGAATEDAGFTDMGNSFAADAANCLAHYGITSGTGDGSTFSPDRGVSRLQMARFLSRAAGPAGIDTMMVEGSSADDVSDLSDEAQDAIDTVVSLGIMDLRDGGFDPSGAVTRSDMAVHIAAFLSKALPGPGETSLVTYQSDDGLMSDDPPFTDIGGVSFSAYGAIKDIFELGITTGTTATTFSPDSPVSRAQMAAFITRALDHTNARPAGLSMQTSTTGEVAETDHTVQVSVRDDAHNPVPDALIDLITTSNPDEAFDDDGACVTANVSGNGPCEIDDDDPATDPDGNTEDASVMLRSDPGTTTVWAWTGEAGDKFDVDENTFAEAEIDVAKPASQVTVSNDMKDKATVLKFGDTITFTLQVANEDDEPVAQEGLEISVTATMEDTSDGDVADDGALRSDSRTTTSVVKTDASGRVELSYTADDPDADEDNQDEMTLTVTLPADLVPAIDTEADADTATDGIQLTAMWVDNDAVASTLTLSQAVNYHLNNDDGVRNTVQATLRDQYGDPVRSQKVSFWSGPTANTETETHGLGGTEADPAAERTTNRSGVATKSYSRSETAKYTESVDANFSAVVGCVDTAGDCDEDNDGTPVPADAVSHYWAMAGDGTVSASAVLVVDTDNNTIVVDESGPTILTYKAGDQFRISGGAVTMEAFEKELSIAGAGGSPTADQVAAVIGDDEDDINTFDITPGS